jgi:hypothetical protein
LCLYCKMEIPVVTTYWHFSKQNKKRVFKTIILSATLKSTNEIKNTVNTDRIVSNSSSSSSSYLCHGVGPLTRSGLRYPDVSSKVCHDSFCQLENSASFPWVIYYEAFYLHAAFSFSCILVTCPKLVLFLIPL